MRFTPQLLAVPILSAVSTVLAAPCTSEAGIANGECVWYFDKTTNVIGSYKPTCAGNCFQYSTFYAIEVAGDGTYGTNCEVYSDSNCKNLIGTTGNTLGAGLIDQFGPAQSMQCFYRC